MALSLFSERLRRCQHVLGAALSDQQPTLLILPTMSRLNRKMHRYVIMFSSVFGRWLHVRNRGNREFNGFQGGPWYVKRWWIILMIWGLCTLGHLGIFHWSRSLKLGVAGMFHPPQDSMPCDSRQFLFSENTFGLMHRVKHEEMEGQWGLWGRSKELQGYYRR